MEYPLSDLSDAEEDEDNGNSPMEYASDITDSEDEVNGDGEQRADEDEVMEDQ